MFLRGSFRWSIARAHTRSAWVESRPPDTPITSFLPPVARMRVASPFTSMRNTSSQQPARRLVADELAAVALLADHDVGRREVGHHRRACERGVGRRRRGHPQVLADLDVQGEAGLLGDTEDESRTERGRLAGELDPGAQG